MPPAIQTPTVAAGPMPPGVSTEVPGGGVVPFTQAAAPPRTSISVATTARPLTGAQQAEVNVLPGTGYLIWIDNTVVLSQTGTNTATVVLHEDAPWSALASITLDDGGPQTVNLDGFSLYLVNVYGGGWFARDPALSGDNTVFQQITAGAVAGGGGGASAGGAVCTLRVPVAINERNYAGLMGNQDRATKYNLRTDLAASSALFTTAPNPLPNISVQRHYGFLPVPGPTAADGRRQEQMPPNYGVIHYLTSVRSDAPPVGGSTINHYIRNLANAVRLFILVFRVNGTRGNAVVPGQIDFVLGTDVVWSESGAERRRIMYSRYGFDAPAGVYVYDCIRDFGVLAGTELGDQWLYLGNISEAQFRINYPAGFGNTNNSLTIITDSLYIPPGVLAA